MSLGGKFVDLYNLRNLAWVSDSLNICAIFEGELVLLSNPVQDLLGNPEPATATLIIRVLLSKIALTAQTIAFLVYTGNMKVIGHFRVLCNFAVLNLMD